MKTTLTAKALPNSKMTANRFARFANARRKVAWIHAMLAEGKSVIVSTCTKSTKYTAKHAGTFRASKSGAFVQSGSKWVCIDFCKITAL